MNSIQKFTKILTKNIKKKFVYLVVFTIFVAILDLVGLSLLMPFITSAVDSSFIQNTEVLKYIFEYFSFNNHKSFIFVFGVLLLFFYSIRFISVVSYSYLSARYINNIAHTIMLKLFNNYMYMEYKKFTSKNTSRLTKALLSETLNISRFIGAILKFISEIFILILFLGLLIYIDWKITITLIIFLAILLLTLVRIIKDKANKAGTNREKFYSGLHIHTGETLSNFLYTKLIGNEKKQLEKFAKNSLGMAKVTTLTEFLSILPKYILETIGIVIIVLLVLYVSYEYKDTSYILPIVGTYSIAFYRLLPSINSILGSFLMFQYAKNAIDDIYDDLQIESEEYLANDIFFDNSIELDNITFTYDNHTIFKKYNLKIKKGEKVAFIGKSGSGKSTLAYIVMGILFPSSGNVLIDGKALDKHKLIKWRKKFGYIPQDIYLFDGTVAQNVAYGRKYDEKKVIQALKRASIYEYFLSKNGIDTIVGEGGIQISGGQKQRVAIARALYDNPEIVVLDEATSALDDVTETMIMDEIYNICKNRTLVIIAHRLSTLNKVDRKVLIHQ